MGAVRIVGGVIVGAIVIFLLVGIFDLVGGLIFDALPDAETKRVPPEANVVGLCLWNLGFYAIATLVGSWLAGVIAGRRSWLVPGIMITLIIAGGVAFALFGKDAYAQYGLDLPAWYIPALPIFGALGAALGGLMRRPVAPPPAA